MRLDIWTKGGWGNESSQVNSVGNVDNQDGERVALGRRGDPTVLLRSFALCCFLTLRKPWASSGVQFGFPHSAGRAGLLPSEERAGEKEC